jgi:hypothetical protein
MNEVTQIELRHNAWLPVAEAAQTLGTSMRTSAVNTILSRAVNVRPAFACKGIETPP